MDHSRDRDLQFARDMQELMPKRAAPNTRLGVDAEAPPTRETCEQRREVFAAEFVVTGDRVAAAKAAGYAPTSAAGAAMLQNPQVRQRVRELSEEKMAAAGITAQRVMQEIARIAFFDIRRLYGENGDLKAINDIDEDTAAGLASVDCEVRFVGKGDAAEPVVTKKVRSHSKMDALNLLSKHFKIVGDEGDGVNALASALADRLDRAHRRMNAAMLQPVEDAVFVEPPLLEQEPQPPAADDEYDLG